MKRHYRFQFGSHYDAVEVDGHTLSSEHSLRVFNHSPGGFAWGYGGSGPAQLALAILLDAGLDEETAVRLHQEFKNDFVADLPQATCEQEFDVEEWVRSQEVPA